MSCQHSLPDRTSPRPWQAHCWPLTEGRRPRRNLAATFPDHRHPNIFSLTKLGGKFIQNQPVKVDAVSKGSVKFCSELFGLDGRIGHDAFSLLRGSSGVASNSVLLVAEDGAAIPAPCLALFDDLATIHDGDAMGNLRTASTKIVRDEKIGDVFVFFADRRADEGSQRAQERRAPTPPR